MAHTYNGTDVFSVSTTLPDDNDPKNVASVNVPFATVMNRTIWLKNRLNTLYNVKDEFRYNDTDFAQQSSIATNAYTTFSDTSGGGNLVLLQSTDSYMVLKGDIVEVSVTFSEHMAANAQDQVIRLAYSTDASTIVGFLGSRIVCKDVDYTTYHPHTMVASLSVLANSTAGLWIALQHKLGPANTGIGYLTSPYVANIKIKRSI